MPVTSNSRYARVPVVEAPDASGEAKAAIGIRPYDSGLPVVVSERLTGLDTIEYLAWKNYRNSAYWWRIADANPLRFPLDWAAGDMVALPSDVEVGRVERKPRI